MPANSMQLVDGHDIGLKTWKSNYSRTALDADHIKFDKAIYDTLQTRVTDKSSKVYTMTLYAGWEANTYETYYDSKLKINAYLIPLKTF